MFADALVAPFVAIAEWLHKGVLAWLADAWGVLTETMGSAQKQWERIKKVFEPVRMAIVRLQAVLRGAKDDFQPVIDAWLEIMTALGIDPGTAGEKFIKGIALALEALAVVLEVVVGRILSLIHI